MSVVIVIPARFQSSRYPGKPLVELRGAGGAARSLIRRSWDAAMAVSGVDRVIVATDDDRIADHAAGFGAEVAMTSTACRNGTERCAEVLGQLPGPPEMIVNLQGDAPLTPPWFIEDLLAGLAPVDDDALAGRESAERLAEVGVERPCGHVDAHLSGHRAAVRTDLHGDVRPARRSVDVAGLGEENEGARVDRGA